MQGTKHLEMTFGTKIYEMNYYQGTMQSKLMDINTKIASGLRFSMVIKIAVCLIRISSLSMKKLILYQGIDVGNDADTSTLNTDKALAELSQTAEQFNTKLIQL